MIEYFASLARKMTDFTGWMLSETRAHLQSIATQYSIEIVETAPPRLHPGNEMGEMRVLRQCVRENEIELTVALEQIGEARTAKIAT